MILKAVKECLFFCLFACLFFATPGSIHMAFLVGQMVLRHLFVGWYQDWPSRSFIIVNAQARIAYRGAGQVSVALWFLLRKVWESLPALGSNLHSSMRPAVVLLPQSAHCTWSLPKHLVILLSEPLLILFPTWNSFLFLFCLNILL